MAVNITGGGDNSPFGPGYVVQYVRNGQAYTEGEGLSWRQSPFGTRAGLNYIVNELLWSGNLSNQIEKCKCEN